ncbi:EF-P beta-lysylation protein EpmB [Hydrogenovibrio sp. 3SP14C1]|uniref:EF-P beta-lysylation protein EpmB n=1 Tax=Hydrogenovibrio sp. 3SP14C1 TaxID=3038774 RepID=UPI0024178476|nr:EF-P beta-lysylation protein EpmB [Hydrogenovibrio sp. 3SP14C1]MDG4812310.1 EF-P beta-lysylation protein EpmB [Hydrogenovibrio sp. 3SP14C1]
MIQSIEQLCDLVELSPDDLPIAFDTDFPFKVPKHFANQIEKGNPNDPLLKQILPGLAENEIYPGFSPDPVGDLAANPHPSLIHKYHGRALLIASPRCDIHCRYCFRRHFPYEQAKQQHWQAALESIAQDPSIKEVILSGGDPMSLSENALIALINDIEAIPHVDTLRIHSRTPIVAPHKANRPQLLKTLQQSRLQKVLVVHCNHANELTSESAELMQQFRQSDVLLLNQTVLLKDINDSANALIALSKKLFSQGILPYYCHLLDKVSGAGHFEIKNAQAWAIFEQMRQTLPGYLVPRFVEEIAGEPYKTLLTDPSSQGIKPTT